MKLKYKLGIIGTGIMASAILDGILNNITYCDFSESDILLYDISKDKLEKYRNKGLCVAENTSEIFLNCEYVFICTKPQHFNDVVEKITNINSKHIISIMAGIKIDTILSKFNNCELGITRVMPNLPCKIGKGVSALAFKNEKEIEFISNLFSFCGKFIIISEDKFDAVTSISGSGPSYVFMFADALIKAGMNGGLTFEESRTLALATLDGSTQLAMQSTENLETLIDNVCSKGGTTIEAVTSFKDDGLYEIINKGVKLCREKSELLSKNI